MMCNMKLNRPHLSSIYVHTQCLEAVHDTRLYDHDVTMINMYSYHKGNDINIL